MADVIISEGEKSFILHGIQQDVRCDGRSNLDYRPIELETGVVTHASGSARLRLANTDVLVGVKAEVDTPQPDHPAQGDIKFFVDCSANATPAFEGRGGESLGADIAESLSGAYSGPNLINLKDLCILEGKFCWVLHVDILILECGGNLYDAVSFAVRAALFNTKMPVVRAAIQDAGKPELELSDKVDDYKTIDTSNMPVIVTFTRIGDEFVVDPSLEEEACSQGELIIGVNPHSTLTWMKQSGGGSLTYHTISQMIKRGKEMGVLVNQVLLKKLQQEASIQSRPVQGFLK